MENHCNLMYEKSQANQLKITVGNFLCSVDRASTLSCKWSQVGAEIILSLFRQFYLLTLHVSDLSRSIVRRNNCIYGTLVTCHFVHLTFCYAYRRDSYTEWRNSLTIICAPIWFHRGDYSGTFLTTFQWGVFNNLGCIDTLTHNVNTVWVLKYSNGMKMFINIHCPLMYNVAKIIFYSPNIHSIIHLQLSEIQIITVHDIHFANSITSLWLKQWLQLALSHIQYRKTFKQCDMCAVLRLRFTGKLWCSISAEQWHFATLPYSSHTLYNTSTYHVQTFEALLLWTCTSDSKKQYSVLKLVGPPEKSAWICTLRQSTSELQIVQTLNT